MTIWVCESWILDLLLPLVASVTIRKRVGVNKFQVKISALSNPLKIEHEFA